MSIFPEFMHYTRNERKGIFILILLILLLSVLPKSFPWFIKEKKVDFKQFDQFVASVQTPDPNVKSSAVLFPFDPNTLSKDSFLLLGLPEKTAQTIINYRNKAGRFYNSKDLRKIYSLSPEYYALLEPYIFIKNNTEGNRKPLYQDSKSLPKRFNFDPNTIKERELYALGLPEKTVQTFLKFRNKGGRFKNKEDLRKIYGLNPSLYTALEPYIQIHSEGFNQKNIPEDATSSPVTKKTFDTEPVDINRATVEIWQSIKGIGPAYAKRIVSFREKLGGFVSVDQVGTTYGLPDSTFQKIKPRLQASPVFRKIDINTASLEELKAHPLISWKQADIINSYRSHHGRFDDFEDLGKIKALPGDMLLNLKPYLNFD